MTKTDTTFENEKRHHLRKLLIGHGGDTQRIAELQAILTNLHSAGVDPSEPIETYRAYITLATVATVAIVRPASLCFLSVTRLEEVVKDYFIFLNRLYKKYPDEGKKAQLKFWKERTI